MKTTKQKWNWTIRQACITGWMMLIGLLLATSNAAHAQQVPVSVNTPVTVTGDIVPGMTQLDLPFIVAGADSLGLDVITPVDAPSFALIDPSGNSVLATPDARVRYQPGSARTPALPGGVFILSDLASPANGTWTVRLTFPAAATKTVVMASILAHSRYQVGIAIERNTLLVGEDVGVGLLVLDNGVPLRGLLPSLSIGLEGVAAQFNPAYDDGQGPDGLVDDGVYSVDHTFSSAGKYSLLGTVEIPTPDGPIMRTASAEVLVVPPDLMGGTTTLTVSRGDGNCVSALNVQQDFDVLTAGTYATVIRLGANNGSALDVRKSRALPSGGTSVSAVFNAKDIRQSLAGDGPYSVKLIDSLKIGQDEFSLGFRKRDAGSFDVKLAELCTDAIELSPVVTITPVLSQGFIASFDVAFPVKVNAAGFYQISFKLVGANGEDIELINASRTLAAGVNNVQVNVQSGKFLTIDGPYRAISLVVVGLGANARMSVLGQSAAFERWQFLPALSGDLNGDGLVDAADVAVLTQYRGVPALVPGDRRDINRDGMIDLRDARALQGNR